MFTLKNKDQARLIHNFFRENEKALLIVLDACNWKILKFLRKDLDSVRVMNTSFKERLLT